jgi:hypothetical protein
MDMEHQQETNWCWAAVAVSIHKFLNSGNLTQGAIATDVLHDENQIPTGVDCSTNPGYCNYPAALDDALRISGDLRPGGFLKDQYLDFDSIKKFVNKGLPLAARIVWASGGAHFIVLDGYREFQSGLKQVHVQDPHYDASFQDYDALVQDYPPGGCWQDTYLVKA